MGKKFNSYKNKKKSPYVNYGNSLNKTIQPIKKETSFIVPEEYIEFIAWKTQAGEVYTTCIGRSHSSIYYDLIEEGKSCVLNVSEDTKGFVTNLGRFVGRNEAAEIAKKAKQSKDTNYLESYQLEKLGYFHNR